MYFLQQIRSQFFSQIALYDGMSGPRLQEPSSEPVLPIPLEKNEVGKLGNTLLNNFGNSMSSEDLQTFIEDFSKKLNDTKLEEKFVMTQMTILINGLTSIAEGKIPGYSPSDDGYIAIRKVITNLTEIHKHLQDEGNQLNVMIQAKLKEVMGEVNEGMSEKFEITDKAEQEYTTESVKTLTEEAKKMDESIRDIFFSQILGIPDEGKPLSDYKDNEKIKSFLKTNDEGLKYGYDISEILKEYDIIKLPGDSINEIQETGEKTEGALIGYEAALTKITIFSRDVQKIDGEKTLGETRLDATQIAYEELLKDQKIKDTLSNLNGVPEFEDLDMDHIDILKTQNIDLKKLFLTTEDGKTFSGGILHSGDSLTINFSTNNTLAGKMDFSFLDNTAQEIEIDNKKLSFQKDGVHGAGYYDENGLEYNLQDGSNIKIISIRSEMSPHQSEAADAAVNERIASLGELSTKEKMFVESVYNNPNDYFEGKTLPKGIFGSILAILSNYFDGTNYVYNSETGRWEDGRNGGSAMTYGEYKNAYIGSISSDLGSLSAEFESSSKGPYAYNSNDNGHGASYGTYQMNTNKGVYRQFIKEIGIAEGQTAWMTEVAKDPKAFQEKEHAFIKKMNFDPMMAKISVKDKEKFSPAIQNVVWSIGVQHGPGNSRLLKVINNSGVIPGDKNSEAKLINALYDERGRIWPSGIGSRYNKERAKAIAMLDAISLGKVGDIYKQGIDMTKLSGFQSEPARYEDRPNGKRMSFCSETARLNLTKMGIVSPKQGGSARASFEDYPKGNIGGFPPEDSEATIADVYLDASKGKETYGHRVVAIKQADGWKVYDPYYKNKIPGYESNTTGAISADDYVKYHTGKGRKIWGAAYFS